MRTPEEVADLIFANFYVLVQPEVVGTGNHESRALMTDGCLKDLMRTELGQRDAEIRRDTIEKAKDVVRRAASDEGDSPRDTLTQYLSGYRDGRQSCSARVLAALDALLQEDPSPDTGKPSADLCDKLIAEAKRAIKEMPNEGFLRRMNYSVPALGVSGVLKTLDRVLRDWKRLGRDVKGVPK